MATFYTDISANQRDGLNFPGGGLTTQPGQFNDPLLELGNVDEIIATYTMVGTEAASDIINVALIPSGQMVDPHSYVSGNGIATTATITVGDLDVAGVGLAASASRYSTSINVASSTADVAWAGGAAIWTPYFMGADAWLTATFATLNTPVAGKVLVFRVRLVANR